MGLNDAMKNILLDYADGQMTHISLHTGYPATGGNEVTGGSPAYARLASAWDAASGGSMALTGDLVFDVPAGTVAAIGFNDAVTAGNLLGDDDVTDEVYAGQGTYTLTDCTIDLNK